LMVIRAYHQVRHAKSADLQLLVCPLIFCL
jgi:hypothetical protein